MATKTIYPDADAETDSCDGYAGRGGATEAWSVIIAGAGTESDDNNTTVSIQLVSYSVSAQWSGLRQGYFGFYTTMPSGYSISSAKMSFYPTSAVADTFLSELAICDATPASDTAIANSDYQLMGSTEYGTTRVAVAGISSGARFEMALNATAITALEAAIDGATAFTTGLVYDWYLDATTPVWANTVVDGVNVASGDHPTPSFRPYLEITYRIGPGYATIKVAGTKVAGADTLTADLWAVEIFK